MDVKLPQGKYVLAVSGGVDSMVLLDLLAKDSGLELIVAHLDHGIREDSKMDRQLVQETAARYGLQFETAAAQLGPKTSEDKARDVRYQFLKQVKQQHGADAIITAHHQDDLVETAVINLLRGTGRRGLSPLATNPEVLRPLLNVPKKKIIEYARQRKIEWREDITNHDTAYLRNYIRHRLLDKLCEPEKHRLLEAIDNTSQIGGRMEELIRQVSRRIKPKDVIDRSGFIELPVAVGREIMAHWLRQRGLEFDKKTVERLSLALKTAKAGSRHDVSGSTILHVQTKTAKFENNR